MSSQAEVALWVFLVILSFSFTGFWSVSLVSTVLRWRRQRNEAWVEWKNLLSILDRADQKAFDNGVTIEDEQDEGTTVTWGLIENSRFRYERASGKRFFFRSRATTSRFGERSI